MVANSVLKLAADLIKVRVSITTSIITVEREEGEVRYFY